ncbi:hypothetical protein [Kitasatospora sp. NA04385]|uniref:hypothetical protein n=1 Tax=Kitasatospora sp. NA04385 TaxID=2742135 RepID=UPI0020CB5B78|nr:hypothetical protein [Kitasatospora sp. NA04385]
MLPNCLLQCRQLSYTARGLLADLLSRPDGWREDGRHMADTSPQGRGAIRRALRELTEAGYYRVEKIRLSDGRIITEAHVYDVPQRPPLPGATRPAPGGPTTGAADVLPKDGDQEPSHPAAPVEHAEPVEPVGEPEAGGGARQDAAELPPVPDAQTREAVAALFRVIRPEPRLCLGAGEAGELAPLVARWLERGATPADLAAALLPGLPVPLHSPAAVLRDRLTRKMPPAARPAPARYAECARCHDPVPRPGICGPCAGLPDRRPASGAGGSARPGSRPRPGRDACRTGRAAGRSGRDGHRLIPRAARAARAPTSGGR